LLNRPGRTVRKLVHGKDLADSGVEVKEVRELATELPHADYSD
jgi:hypothetical protein